MCDFKLGVDCHENFTDLQSSQTNLAMTNCADFLDSALLNLAMMERLDCLGDSLNPLAMRA